MRYEEREKEIQTVVKAMLESYDRFPDIIRISRRVHIEPAVVVKTIEDLRQLIYPGFFDNGNMCEYTKEYFVRDTLSQARHDLAIQIERAYRHADDANETSDMSPVNSTAEGNGGTAEVRAAKTADDFLRTLPEIRALLAGDVEAAFDGDPASTGIGEIILSYPGIYAITAYRLAHVLWSLGVPLIPRFMTEYAHGKTGIDIHPGATIGQYFFLDHGTGVVIGETARIGDHVKIYQGVTLGAHSTKGGRKLAGNKRHPDIEDHVTIYSGASILGGDTVIGEGSVIGSNAFITTSVPAGSRISGETIITKER